MSFLQKYQNIIKKNNTFVTVGLDSDIHKIPPHLKTEKNPVLIFNKRIIEETYKDCAAYKPNFAFYISQGFKGIETLKKTIDFIPKEIPIIIDIKAGDIGNTMEQYAVSVFEYLKADAMTINILMGSDVINAVFKKENNFAFALVLTSNESANDYFKYQDLYKKIALKVDEVGYDKLGAVVGATQIDDLSNMRVLMPNTIFLVPGIGSQGGDLKQVCQCLKYSNEDPRFLINSSRNIIFADKSVNFAKAAKIETIKLKESINSFLF